MDDAYVCGTCHGRGNPNGPCLECNQSSRGWPAVFLIAGPLIAAALVGAGITAMVMLWL